MAKQLKIKAKEIINWRAVSKILANNTDSIRDNRRPKVYEQDIDSLVYYVNSWREGKILISEEDLREKIKDLDLISVLLGI